MQRKKKKQSVKSNLQNDRREISYTHTPTHTPHTLPTRELERPRTPKHVCWLQWWISPRPMRIPQAVDGWTRTFITERPVKIGKNQIFFPLNIRILY